MSYWTVSTFWEYILIVMFYVMQIAQVHRATLIDGREVVVKVQHQGIKTIILEVIHVLF